MAKIKVENRLNVNFNLKASKRIIYRFLNSK